MKCRMQKCRMQNGFHSDVLFCVFGAKLTGSSRYRGHKRRAVMLHLLATCGFPPIRAGVRALRPSPRPHFGPSALLATVSHFPQAGWNRGVYNASPLNLIRGGVFLFSAPSSVQSPHHSQSRNAGLLIPLPCTSSPNRTHCVGLRFGLGRKRPFLERSNYYVRQSVYL